MTDTIFKEYETLQPLVVGAFFSRNKKVINYYWYARESGDLLDRIRRNTNKWPAYIIRVKPHDTAKT